MQRDQRNRLIIALQAKQRCLRAHLATRLGRRDGTFEPGDETDSRSRAVVFDALQKLRQMQPVCETALPIVVSKQTLRDPFTATPIRERATKTGLGPGARVFSKALPHRGERRIVVCEFRDRTRVEAVRTRRQCAAQEGWITRT